MRQKAIWITPRHFEKTYLAGRPGLVVIRRAEPTAPCANIIAPYADSRRRRWEHPCQSTLSGPLFLHGFWRNNITAAERSGVCDYSDSAYGTIVRTEGQQISGWRIPCEVNFGAVDRRPKFRIKYFEDDYGALSDEDKRILTDACKIFVLAGRKVKIVEEPTT